MTVNPLTPQQAAILAFAGRIRYGVASDPTVAAVHDLFGMSETRYFQALNRVIDLPAALIADPVLVKRLRRQRDAARVARTRPTPIEAGR